MNDKEFSKLARRLVEHIPDHLLDAVPAKLEALLDLEEAARPLVLSLREKLIDGPERAIKTAGGRAHPDQIIQLLSAVYILNWFARSIDIPPILPAASARYDEYNPSAVARLRAWLKIPADHPVPGIIAMLRERRDDLEKRILTLTERVIASVRDAREIAIENEHIIGHDALSRMLKEPAMPSPMAEIPFYRAESVDIRDLARTTTTAPATAPQPAAIQPALAPAPDHRARADALQDHVNQLQSRLSVLERRQGDEENASSQMRDLHRSQRARIRILEQALERSRASSPAAPSELVIPDRWDALPTFIDEHLAGRVVLTPKAIRLAKASVFEDVAFAYRVLLMLAQDFVPMRQGEVGARARYEARCAELRVSVGPTGQAVDHHLTKAAYRAQHLGKFVTLDLHVQGSSSRDPREGFRCYFSYIEEDDGRGYVLVGSLPAHLDSTLS